ncbi:hypothetical protein E2C01_004410 [Portunus trituberculatus]|uniref:Uncharacterized protein n=1 Tax=Portunus trituberculatus TaxID=210409 RepID=A0A5B7CTZ4_PORTR|nr:hypothetical protein [Portunus trituberculatus]
MITTMISYSTTIECSRCHRPPDLLAPRSSLTTPRNTPTAPSPPSFTCSPSQLSPYPGPAMGGSAKGVLPCEY